LPRKQSYLSKFMAEARSDIEVIARSRLPAILSDALGLGANQVRVIPAKSGAYDFAADAGGRSLLIEVLGPSMPSLLHHWEQLRRAAKKRDIPIVVVPFMTKAGRELCSEHEINWVDLAGNASVRAPGLQIRIDGRPNQLARRGRPPSVFERRSSRLTRVLLQHVGRDWSVRDCAKASGLNEGHVSRIVARLVAERLLAKDGKRVRVAEPRQLLDAWRDASDFAKHRILKGHIPARSGEELLGLVSKRLIEAQLEHAATGLGAAWLYDHFAMFRLATLFVREWPTPAQLEQLHFREDLNGSNVWLVLPADDGVFEGARPLEGIPCVHPIQVYVDLKGQPERANEASEHLKQSTLLFGGTDGAA
jgi:hypothetical protein